MMSCSKKSGMAHDTLVSLFTTMGDDYFKSHVAGTQQCARALGIAYEGYVNENTPERQLSQFEVAAGKGVKMLTVIPPDNSNVPAIFKRANEYEAYAVLSAEIPPWYFPHQEGPYGVSFITPFDYNSYYDVSKYLLEYLGGAGNLLMITGFPGGTPDILRTAAAERAISEYPNIKLMGALPGRWNRVDGQKAMEDLMTAHPSFDAVLCLNDEMAIGALSALDGAGRENVPVIGHNGTTEVMSFIKEGRILATASTFPFWIGAYMVAMAYDAANGYQFQLPERMLISQHAIVNKTTVDMYIDKFVNNYDNLPFDFRKMSRVLHPDDWDPQNAICPLDIEEYFRFQSKPKGFVVPHDWQLSINSGEPQNTAELFKKHYRMKILSQV